MKRYLINAISLLLLSVICFGCGKEEAQLLPTEGNEGYTLPQGNHDYDTRILNYYKKYGTYFLYEFSDKEAYWTPSGYKNAVKQGQYWSDGFEMKAADQGFIGQQLDLFESQCLNLYSEKFLKAFLPSKILLCSEVDSIYNEFDFSTSPATVVKGMTSVAAWYNYNNLLLNYGNSKVLTITPAEKKLYLAKVNLSLINSITEAKKTAPSTAFAGSANYAIAPTSDADAYAKGMLTPYYNGPTATSDWYLYLQAMVSFSEDNLNRMPDSWDTSFTGILNPAKDVNGIIKRRYDLVRNYFRENYNVDLQLIGNAAQAN